MSYLQLASWNIEHLRGSARENRPQSAYALAEHIEMAGIDLIALQEIYVTDPNEQVRIAANQPVVPVAATGDWRNGALDLVCYLLEEHLEVPWTYTILPNRAAGDRSQLCAVMWNAARLNLKETLPLNVQHADAGDALWDRKPHVLRFSGDILVWRKDASGQWHQTNETRSLSLVPLHMKSNHGGVTKNRRVRAKEAQTLCEALAAVRDDIDPSLVLLGDTNILSNQEPAIETFVDNGLIDLNNNDGKTYWSRDYPEAPFDRIFVAANRPEFRYTRQYILRSADLELHDRFLSDHYMIKASIKDYLDDADPR